MAKQVFLPFKINNYYQINYIKNKMPNRFYRKKYITKILHKIRIYIYILKKEHVYYHLCVFMKSKDIGNLIMWSKFKH